MKNPHPGTRGDHRSSRQTVALTGGVAQPGGQQKRGVRQRMGALALHRRLCANLHAGHLHGPVAWRKRNPGAQNQGPVQLLVGQLGQPWRVEPVLPARIDDFNRHTHRIDQFSRPSHIQRHREFRAHLARQPQGNLGLNAAQMKRPVCRLGGAAPHASGRKWRVGQHRLTRRTARFPVARRQACKPAKSTGYGVLCGIGRLGIGQVGTGDMDLSTCASCFDQGMDCFVNQWHVFAVPIGS